jgi:hypothetical protein
MPKRKPPTRPLPNPRTAQQPPAMSGRDLVRMIMNPLSPPVSVVRQLKGNKRGRAR